MGRVQKGLENKYTECIRCGSCCKADMTAYVTDEDLRRWEQEERYDLIARVGGNEVIWAGDQIIDRSGKKLESCTYLNTDGSSSYCGIYDSRPLVCRNFIPGSSELCPLCYIEE